MGIRNLNNYLRTNASESIRCLHMSDLSGKKIAIDISIYLYKYESENSLIENIYLMISIFRHYNVIPVFIFDGKPPDEKKELLKIRKNDKCIAYQTLKDLELKLIEEDADDKKQDIVSIIEQLKKKIVKINKTKIEEVKRLIVAYGSVYYDALGEADELCALLVIKKKVWACMSEDMDLFLYGCNRVIRYFSLLEHSVVLYYTKGILKQINMTQKEFNQICVLSGTDYNIKNIDADFVHLSTSFDLFYEFKKTGEMHFYNWLENNTDYKINKESLKLVFDMFDLDKNTNLMHTIKKINIVNKTPNKTDLENIMKLENFMFCN